MPFPNSSGHWRFMQYLKARIQVLLLLLAGGCAPVAQYPPGGVLAYGPPAPPTLYENPMLVSARDPALVWETVVDVVDDYFRIDREDPLRQLGGLQTDGILETFPQVGATLLEPWHQDSADRYQRLESTLQSIRRVGRVRVTPAGGGYWIEVAVFKQLEDCAQPAQSTAGAATFRYDDTLTRVVNPVAEVEVTQGWIDQGRDPALEQRLLAELAARLGRVPPSAPVSAVGPSIATPGGSTTMPGTTGCGGAAAADCGSSTPPGGWVPATPAPEPFPSY
ncbi:MAG: hypothetical protein ACOY3P_16320 [Planctomycetota bacterium]